MFIVFPITRHNLFIARESLAPFRYVEVIATPPSMAAARTASAAVPVVEMTRGISCAAERDAKGRRARLWSL